MELGMVDWMLDLLRVVMSVLDQASLWGVAIVTAIGVPFLTFVHELGHAVAVRVRRLPLVDLAVGDADDLIVRVGGVLLRFGRTLEDRGAAGFVRYDASTASPGDVIVIALAGPLANALVAPLLAGLALIGGSHGSLDACLLMLAAMSLLSAVGNLIPRGVPGTSKLVSDGRAVQLAWAARHVFPSRRNEIDARPPAPSPTPRAEQQRRTGLRWPFAFAIVFVALLAFALGGAALLVPLLILFGGFYLQGAHRSKVW